MEQKTLSDIEGKPPVKPPDYKWNSIEKGEKGENTTI